MNCPICNKPMQAMPYITHAPGEKKHTVIYTCQTPGSCKGLTGDAAQIEEIRASDTLKAQYTGRKINPSEYVNRGR